MFDRFKKGLEKRGYIYEDIKTWKYCGGDRNSKLEYFYLNFKNERELPQHEDKCVCGHKIKENCYITNKDIILVLGNCCIKKYIDKSGRTCEKCGKPHQRRKINLCKECDVKPKTGKLCEICGEPHRRRITNRCQDCSDRLCNYCDKECNYDECWDCKNEGRPETKKCEKCDSEFKTRNELKNHCNACVNELIPKKCNRCEVNIYLNVQIHFVKKTGLNKGKIFYKCNNCNKFEWITLITNGKN